MRANIVCADVRNAGKRGNMSHRRYDRSVFQSLALLSQFGITMLVPMALMFALGWWLDGLLGTSFLAVALFFAGALAGFGNVYRLARQVFRNRDGAREGDGENGRKK